MEQSQFISGLLQEADLKHQVLNAHQDKHEAEIIARGIGLGVDYGATHSCYDPVGELACGRCDACILRRDGFAAAHIDDPTRYDPQFEVSR